jgi:3-deoxy-D-manno-octulosonate 8-phosphate phosphatase (KDO 8-P phosphatase)
MLSGRFLFRDDLGARARRIRLVVIDVDGVLTDGRVFYSAGGEELLSFSRRDTVAIRILADAGIRTALVSREDSEVVRAWAKELSIRHVFLGIEDKLDLLATLEEAARIRVDQIAAIAGDASDADLLAEIGRRGGLAFGPSDASAGVRRAAHGLTEATAGHGALREVVDYLLELRHEVPRPVLPQQRAMQ